MHNHGFRSSDVANLRFSNIDWEREVIHLNQVKTGNPLELPLLEDVGEAIINYLKNARPETDSDHVFVRQLPSYSVKPKFIDFTGFDDFYLPLKQSRE